MKPRNALSLDFVPTWNIIFIDSLLKRPGNMSRFSLEELRKSKTWFDYIKTNDIPLLPILQRVSTSNSVELSFQVLLQAVSQLQFETNLNEYSKLISACKLLVNDEELKKVFVSQVVFSIV